MSYDILTGVSLYSYQSEISRGKMTLEDCIFETAKTGLKGIELWPELMEDEYPNITDEFRVKWFQWMKQYDLEPTCFDISNQHFIGKEMLVANLAIAGELGFKILGISSDTPIETVKGSLSKAEAEDIIICVKLTSKLTPRSESVQRYLKLIVDENAKYLGFIGTWNSAYSFKEYIDYIYHVHMGCPYTDSDSINIVEESVDGYKKAGYRGYLCIGYENEKVIRTDDNSIAMMIEVYQEWLKKAIEK